MCVFVTLVQHTLKVLLRKRLPVRHEGGGGGRERKRERTHFLPADDATKYATTSQKERKPQLQYFIIELLSHSDVCN